MCVCVSASVCARARARALTDHLHGGLPSAGTYTLLTDSCGSLPCSGNCVMEEAAVMRQYQLTPTVSTEAFVRQWAAWPGHSSQVSGLRLNPFTAGPILATSVVVVF